MVQTICPQKDGYIIERARALYSMVFEDLSMFSDINCDTSVKACYRKGHGSSFGGAQDDKLRMTDGRQQYSLYPNPNGGAFSLVQMVAKDEQVNAEILNITGETVYKGMLNFEGGTTKLMMRNKAPGAYLIKLYDSTGNYTLIKFTIE